MKCLQNVIGHSITSGFGYFAQRILLFIQTMEATQTKRLTIQITISHDEMIPYCMHFGANFPGYLDTRDLCRN